MKTNLLYFWIIFLGMVILTPDSDAQFYQYKDKNGAIVYTDDLSKIPLDQRESAKKYTSSSENRKPVEKKEAAPTESKVLNAGPPAENFEAQRESLYKEYEALTKEKDQLLKEKDLINSPLKQEAYNKKTNQLNERIEDFKSRIKEFNIKASQ